jgi:hypothetical protein
MTTPVVRKRLIKLVVLFMALFPFGRAAVAYVETFNAFGTHPEYSTFVWSHHEAPNVGISRRDYHITVTPITSSPTPFGACAFEVRGTPVEHGFHHKPLPKGNRWSGCDDAITAYMATGQEKRTVLCQAPATNFAADVSFTPDPGCPVGDPPGF